MPFNPVAPAGALDPSDVAAHYDDLDPYYRSLWGEHVHHGLFDVPGATPEEATRRLVDVVADRAGIVAGSTVCDVGCGYGGTARMLWRERGARVLGVTISAAQHAHARSIETEADGPEYLLGDWLANDLPAEAFDAVLAIESTEHMTDLGRFYDEASRVLRSGGRLVVCAWLTRDVLRDWERGWLIEPICREGRMRALETVEQHRSRAQAAGLEPIEVQDVSRQVARTWTICARRVAGTLLRDRSSRQFLLRDGGPNRVFALTVLRIALAYKVGAMRYGIVTYGKPSG